MTWRRCMCVIAVLTSFHSVPHRLGLGMPILPIWWEVLRGWLLKYCCLVLVGKSLGIAQHEIKNFSGWLQRNKKGNTSFSEGKLAHIQTKWSTREFAACANYRHKTWMQRHRWAQAGEEFGGEALVSGMPDSFALWTLTEARKERDSNGEGSPTTSRVSCSDLPQKKLKEYLLLSSSYLSLPYVTWVVFSLTI